MAGRPKAPKPTTIFFVRHGRTPTTGKVLPGRAPGLHLSDEGRAQAEAVAGRIASVPNVAAVYASPMERTRETAAPIARALGCKVVIERGLLECDFGEWTGAELKSLAKLPEWQQVQRHPSGFRFPGGESFLEMQSRLSDVVRKLVAAHPGQTVVAVSHADPVKVVTADAMGTHLDHFQRFDIAPCSVTVVAYGAGGPFVLTVSSSGTLPGAAAPATAAA
jgi:probable phosphoglycerate mutase